MGRKQKDYLFIDCIMRSVALFMRYRSELEAWREARKIGNQL